MAGLKDRVITIKFPELAEPGDPDPYVTMRNPKLVPMDWLISKLAVGPDGVPLDLDAARHENRERMARLITDMRMYDAEDMSDDQALLTLPCTAETVARFPTIVATRLADEFAKVNQDPTKTPDSPTS